MKKTAMIIGGALNVWSDIDEAYKLFKPDIIIAINDIGVEWPGSLDHWVSFHTNVIERLANERKKRNLPSAGKYWTGPVLPKNVKLPFTGLQVRGGSSGLLACYVCLQVAEKGILCGVPMDPNMRHFHDKRKGKKWADGNNYLDHWEEQKDVLLGRIKSMSGNTKELLGAPTKEWLAS